MKTAAALRLVPAHGEARRNRRVARVQRASWQAQRLEAVRRSIQFAAVAKSYRTLRDVTQQEVADAYGVSAGAVSRWESGFYQGWDDAGLRDYQRRVDQIARPRQPARLYRVRGRWA